MPRLRTFPTILPNVITSLDELPFQGVVGDSFLTFFAITQHVNTRFAKLHLPHLANFSFWFDFL